MLGPLVEWLGLPLHAAVVPVYRYCTVCTYHDRLEISEFGKRVVMLMCECRGRGGRLSPRWAFEMCSEEAARLLLGVTEA